MKQGIFKNSYVNKLKQAIQNGSSIDDYKSPEFPIDKNQLLFFPNIEKPEGLLEKLDVDDDCKTAIELFEAFKNLELIQAADERFWTYLAHVDLYPYMIKRWDKVYLGIADEKYINDHWFLTSSAQSNLMRHALSGLWWAVYLSIDEERGGDKYVLTKILFRILDFPTRTLGTYKLGRHKEAVMGILEFIQENDSLFRSRFEYKTRFVTKYLNFIGGAKPICYYDRSFFKDELNKIIDKIEKA